MSAASTAGISALKTYSLKADTRIRGPYHDGSTYIGEDLIVNLYPWQSDIKSELDGPPDRRRINVLVDEKGNTGKSAFSKYLHWHYQIPILGWGRTGDILHLVSKMPNRRAYIFDLSRSKPQDWGRDDIASAMEGIKNGLFMNTKYECSQVCMKVPHIWVFTNHIPNISSMSRDRWRFWTLRHHRLVAIPLPHPADVRGGMGISRTPPNSPSQSRSPSPHRNTNDSNST